MKVLIIGHGFLGKKLSKLWSQGKALVSVASLKGESNSIDLDINDSGRLTQVFEEIKPEVVVLTAAVTNVDLCEKDPPLARKVNVEGVKNVVEACRKFGAKLVFISTDFVFDGQKGNYSETDQVKPINVYGQSKFEAEQAVLVLPEALVLRTSTLYGFNDPSDKNNFVKWALNSLKAGQQIKVVTDQKSSPTLIDDLSQAVIALVEKNRQGVFHAVGSEAISRFDFVKKIAEVFSLDFSLVQPILSAQLNQAAARPKDSSLSIAKLEASGIKMSSCLAGLKAMKSQMESYS